MGGRRYWLPIGILHKHAHIHHTSAKLLVLLRVNILKRRLNLIYGLWNILKNNWIVSWRWIRKWQLLVRISSLLSNFDLEFFNSIFTVIDCWQIKFRHNGYPLFLRHSYIFRWLKWSELLALIRLLEHAGTCYWCWCSTLDFRSLHKCCTILLAVCCCCSL